MSDTDSWVCFEVSPKGRHRQHEVAGPCSPEVAALAAARHFDSLDRDIPFTTPEYLASPRAIEAVRSWEWDSELTPIRFVVTCPDGEYSARRA